MTTWLTCKRKGCNKPVTQDQMAYCSRDCAPFGWYGIEHERDGKRKNKCQGRLAYKEPKIQHKRRSEIKETPAWLTKWREFRASR